MKFSQAVATFALKNSFIKSRLQIELSDNATFKSQHAKVSTETYSNTAHASLLYAWLHLNFTDGVIGVAPEISILTQICLVSFAVSCETVWPVPFSELTEIESRDWSKICTLSCFLQLIFLWKVHALKLIQQRDVSQVSVGWASNQIPSPLIRRVI